jgi:hypothetical protein
MMEWQPIETAPKDGTWVLVIDETDGAVEIAQWSVFFGRWKLNGYGLFFDNPTYWIPLPSPPTTGEKL